MAEWGMAIRPHDHVADGLEQLGFGRGAARRLSRAGTLLDVGPDTVLCEEGERGSQALLLLEGAARVLTPDAVIEVGPGAVIGEIATLDRRLSRTASVVTSSPARILVFDVPTFRSLASQGDLRERLAPNRTAA